MKARTLEVVEAAWSWAMALFCIFTTGLAIIAGCANLVPVLDSSSLDVVPLVEQHDEWVESDPYLTPDAVAAFEAESAALLELIASVDQLPQPAFASALGPVVDRYDDYLKRTWALLLPLQRRYLSRTSDLARDVAGLPLASWPPFVE